ncbi:MAG TPA: hypothetical protein VHY91_21100 [Pirellulales bacterium]|jgi:hypothetical protein|nr:hypothetical protein [Pirellulales bacterium]
MIQITAPRLRFSIVVLLAIPVLLAPSAGCSRAFYRISADREVDFLVGQKAADLGWTMPRFPTYLDPRSRYFDPTSPDAPAMPFDDPVAHQYMHRVNRMSGWPCWHVYGDWWGLEAPNWRDAMHEYAEFTPDGRFKLSAESAVRAGIINSSTYRTNIETLYISALDVSSQRFQFVTQLYTTNTTSYLSAGPQSAASSINPAGEASTLTTATNPNLTKMFAAGGTLAVGIANSFVWQFAGPNTNQTHSLLNFSFMQPLLQFGGRGYILEPLTIVERQLLANLRAFQRFRQGFYTLVVIGDATNVSGPQRDGGFAGGTGLTGFSGTGTGGFGQLGQVVNFGGRSPTAGAVGGGAGGGGAIGFASGNAGLVAGFVGLLQQLQQIRNTEASLNAQLRSLRMLEAHQEAGTIEITQVDLLRQNIESERSNLLQAQVNLANTLDIYKAGTLGLPPNMPVELDDSMIEQFKLVDPKTTQVLEKIDDFITLLGELPHKPTGSHLEKSVQVIAGLRDRLAQRFAVAHNDLKRLDQALPERFKLLDNRSHKQLQEDRDKLNAGLIHLETRFANTEADLDAARQLADTDPSKSADDLVTLASSLSGMTQELSLVQARARLESISLPKIDLDPKRAIDIARANRLDWMNNRMGVVDTWRLIYFNANQLKSGLNLTFNGALNTTNNNPVRFKGSTGTADVGVQFSAPLTRRLQRNNFRAQLMSYQQQRRSLIQFQDGVYQTLRNYLRSLKQLELLLEIQRRATVIAVRRADQTRELLNQPPEPVAAGAQATLLPPTAAQNLTLALGDLRTAQNAFMSAWLNHYETRMMLYRDLGIMELDDEGMWIDRPLNESDWIEDELCPLPPPIPNHWLHEVDIQGDAEAEPLPPGAGSSRADTEATEWPAIERIFSEPPLEENVPPRAPGEEAPPPDAIFPGGNANRRRGWSDPSLAPPEPEQPPPWYRRNPERVGLFTRPPPEP